MRGASSLDGRSAAPGLLRCARNDEVEGGSIIPGVARVSPRPRRAQFGQWGNQSLSKRFQCLSGEIGRAIGLRADVENFHEPVEGRQYQTGPRAFDVSCFLGRRAGGRRGIGLERFLDRLSGAWFERIGGLRFARFFPLSPRTKIVVSSRDENNLRARGQITLPRLPINT